MRCEISTHSTYLGFGNYDYDSTGTPLYGPAGAFEQDVAFSSTELRKRGRLCKNSEARPYVGVEREQRHSILELDDQFFDFSHSLEGFLNMGSPPSPQPDIHPAQGR